MHFEMTINVKRKEEKYDHMTNDAAHKIIILNVITQQAKIKMRKMQISY